LKKLFQVCGEGTYTSQFEYSLCQERNLGNFINKISNTRTNKTSYLLLNFISENIIGFYLNKILNYYTPAFPVVYDFSYGEYKVFTEMEELTNTNIIDNENKLLIHIFQICQGLSVAQQVCKFTHHDFHTGNVMLRKVNNKINIYELPNGKYLYTKVDFETVIIDFGFSRMETDKYVVIPKIELADFLDDFEYNPYIDLINFLYFSYQSMFGKDDEYFKDVNYYPELNKDKKLRVLYLRLLNELLNTSYSDDKIILDVIRGEKQEKNYSNMNNKWRFKPEKLSQLKFKTENNRILSATEFLQKMSVLLEEKSYKNEDILSNLDKNHFVVSSKRINITHVFILDLQDGCDQIRFALQQKRPNSCRSSLGSSLESYTPCSSLMIPSGTVVKSWAKSCVVLQVFSDSSLLS
jgi:hypothetical protein